MHISRQSTVSQPIFPNLYDHGSYIHWIVGILNPTDSLTKKFSLVLYCYSRPSSELKECKRLFHLRCVSVLFLPLMDVSYFSVTEQVSAFIHHLRRIYRYENSYHNFEHALDVLQAAQSYLKSEGMVPSPTILFEPARMWKPKKQFDSGSLISSLGLRQLFILYIAAIGHDVGHPGFSNVFMVGCINLARIFRPTHITLQKNAQTPLSVVFNHQSALENLHCQLLLRVMRYHGLGVLLDDPYDGPCLRRILLFSVLATDMGVHQDFMMRFRRMLDGESTSLCARQTLICEAILKNADISNPVRPFKFISDQLTEKINRLVHSWFRSIGQTPSCRNGLHKHSWNENTI